MNATNLIERARAYVARMEAAVSGSHGHNATFKVAIALRHGFGLTLNQAWPLMLEFNERCVPPWSHNTLHRSPRPINSRHIVLQVNSLTLE